MFVDHKPNPDSQPSSNALQQPGPSTSERKLSIELPSQRQIYTTGSVVTGIVHLGSKETEKIQDIQVSLVCLVRSIYSRHYGKGHDFRRETTKLIHRDHTLWSSSRGDHPVPPADLPFEFIIPDVGHDKRSNGANTPLPPSFHPERREGWMAFFSPSIGFVKYQVQVTVSKKGALSFKEKAAAPFVFLPPSPPPPLFPTLPESIAIGSFRPPGDAWILESNTATLRHAVVSSAGQATLELWLPRVPSFPRLIPIPFIMCLTLQTRHVKQVNGAEGPPSEDILPPLPQLDKASIFLRQTIRACARHGRQTHVRTRDTSPLDNLLHWTALEEGPWTAKSVQESGKQASYWEKQYVWRGQWTCKATPNFANRQLTWEYVLVAEVPIKGLGNGVKIISQELDISSGVTQGVDDRLNSEEQMLDLPPDYFGDQDDDDDDNEKGEKS